MPEDNSDADGDIERMLRPELGNLQTKVTLIDHVLPHPADFISENKGIFPPRFRAEVIEHQRLCGLLGGNDRITLSLQPADGLEGVLDLLPRQAVLGPEGGFMNLGRRRTGTYSAKPHLVSLERIPAAEGRAHVMGTSDIVQDQHKARFREIFVLLGADSAQFNIQ